MNNAVVIPDKLRLFLDLLAMHTDAEG